MSDIMTFPSSQRASEAQSVNYENMTQNDLAIINAKYDRKKFIAALDAGTLARVRTARIRHPMATAPCGSAIEAR